jgi:hypothetical protein
MRSNDASYPPVAISPPDHCQKACNNPRRLETKAAGRSFSSRTRVTILALRALDEAGSSRTHARTPWTLQI